MCIKNVNVFSILQEKVIKNIFFGPLPYYLYYLKALKLVVLLVAKS